VPFTVSAGCRLWFEVIEIAAPWESNPATILLHHGIGADSGIWTDWIASLVGQYRIVRFDMRGFGRSEAPARGSGWSMDRLTDDLIAVADVSGTERFHFVGESIGGTIGLSAALKHPSRFLSLTMSNAGHVGGSIHKVETWRRTIDERGMAGWSDEFMADRFHPDALAPERREWFARQQAAGHRDAVLNALAVLVGVDLSASAELASVPAPVLILHPDGSPFIPVEAAVQLYRELPDAELHVFGHAKHGLPFSHGRESAAVLRRFLDRRFPRSRASERTAPA
jgi:pimeloyl-ACP methyl ester carboxylesterase